MKFNKLIIHDGIFTKSFLLKDGINLIYSQQNGTGKTTLVRLLLYSLGYPIPSTKGMAFDRLSTEAECVLDNDHTVTLLRTTYSLQIITNSQTQEFSLPHELNVALKIIFGISNSDVLNNLLGSFYIDQEKGWTLLNDGTVIGAIHFDVRELVRGLTNKDCSDLLKKKASLDYQIGKYKKMLSISEYKRQINNIKGSLTEDSYQQQLEDKLSALNFEKMQLEEELNEIRSILKEQNDFCKYIEKMHLVIVYDGKEIPVKKDNVKFLSDSIELATARKRILECERFKIHNKINELESLLNREEMIVDTKTMIEYFDESVANMNLDSTAIAKVLNKLKQESHDIQEEIDKRTSFENEGFLNEFYDITYTYLEQLGVAQYAMKDSNYLFTRDLRSMSGAVLQLTTLAYKLAYIKMIQKVTKIILPIILDSPRGRELDDDNIEKIKNLLVKSFADHQIIVASIYKDFDATNIITIKNRLMEEEQV